MNVAKGQPDAPINGRVHATKKSRVTLVQYKCQVENERSVDQSISSGPNSDAGAPFASLNILVNVFINQTMAVPFFRQMRYSIFEYQKFSIRYEEILIAIKILKNFDGLSIEFSIR